MMKFRFILLLAVTIILLPFATKAAVLYFEPDEISLGPGDSARVDIKIDINTGCVNTIEGTVLFPEDFLQVKNFLTGESVLSIWVDKPGNIDLNRINDNGELHFSGGTPGGYCGKIPGDPGVSNIVGSLIVEMPSFIISDRELENGVLSFIDPTRALLNDGFGTEDMLLTKSMAINFLERPLKTGSDPLADIKNDSIPPEPFVIELHSRDDMFDGKYFILFNTTDKQTGVDRFEVLEIRPGEEIGVEPESSFLDGLLGEKREAPGWVNASIPYVLKDQNLLSTIRVRAIDKAGNERLVEYVPPQSLQKAPPDKDTKTLYLAIGGVVGLIAIFLVVLLFIILIKKLIKRRQHEEE